MGFVLSWFGFAEETGNEHLLPSQLHFTETKTVRLVDPLRDAGGSVCSFYDGTSSSENDTVCTCGSAPQVEFPTSTVIQNTLHEDLPTRNVANVIENTFGPVVNLKQVIIKV